jgi:hypothetical protein
VSGFDQDVKIDIMGWLKMEQTKQKRRISEKRTNPRIACNFPATLESLRFPESDCIEEVRVVKWSSSGVLVLADQFYRKNAEVRVKIALTSGALEWGVSRLAAYGNVVRNELHCDGTISIAIKFQKPLSY